MFFHSSCQKDNIPLKLPMLAINAKVNKRTTSIKFLGILLDEHHSWKNHNLVVENKILEFYIKPKMSLGVV